MKDVQTNIFEGVRAPRTGRAKLNKGEDPSAPPPWSSNEAPPPVKLRNAAQNRPVFRNATLGPRRDSSRPYPMRRTKLKGLTHAMARGKAAGFVKPAVLDVKSDRLAERANSYPKKCSAIDRLMNNADFCRNAVTASGLGLGVGVGLDFEDVFILPILVDAEVNTTFSVRLPLEDDGDALRYGMMFLGRTPLRASFVLGPPDAAQNCARLSNSDTDGTHDVASDSTVSVVLVLYEDNNGNGKPAPTNGAALSADMDRCRFDC